MKTLSMLALMLLASLSIASADEAKVETTTRGGKPYFEASNTVTGVTSVLAIDKAARKLTLKAVDGDTVIIDVKPDVKTFEQIKVGDRIKVTYTETFTVHVESSGSPEVVSESMRSDAKPGDAPQAKVTERSAYKAVITALDKTKGTATLKDADGEEFTITPLHPENLDLVKVGEVVVFTTTQSVAASIEKAPAAKKPAKK